GGRRLPLDARRGTAGQASAGRGPGPAPRSGLDLVANLAAQVQALVADPGLRRRRHASDPMTALPAEAAPLRLGLTEDRVDVLEPERGLLPGDRCLDGDRRLGLGNAPVPDAHTLRPGDQRLCD